jgi:hypothetical protein
MVAAATAFREAVIMDGFLFPASRDERSVLHTPRVSATQANRAPWLRPVSGTAIASLLSALLGELLLHALTDTRTDMQPCCRPVRHHMMRLTGSIANR